MFSVRPRVILENKTQQQNNLNNHLSMRILVRQCLHFSPQNAPQFLIDKLITMGFMYDLMGKWSLFHVFFDQVKTDNQNLTPQQNAVARLIVNPFDAENGPLIMVRQLTHGKVTLIVRSTLSDLKFKIFWQ